MKHIEYRHWLFTDNDSGEDFIIGEPTIEEAWASARTWFADPSFICELSDDEAEMSGLDEF